MNDWWKILLIGLLCVIAAGLCVFFGYLVGVNQPTPEPLVLKEFVTVEVPYIVEKEVIQTVEVEKIVEVLVTPTPAPLQVTAPPEPVVTEAAPPCYDAAWVVMQPRSDLQAGALEKGKGKKLTFRLRNDGTCVWDGYVLSNYGETPSIPVPGLPDIPMPLTYPGEIAEFSYYFTAYTPFEAHFYITPPTTEGALLLGNSASPGMGLETMYYRLDVKQPAWSGSGGASYVCDSKG